MEKLILRLVNCIKQHINNFSMLRSRKRKTNLLDAFVFRLLYSEINKSQETVAAKINFNKDTQEKIHRSSFAQKEKRFRFVSTNNY